MKRKPSAERRREIAEAALDIMARDGLRRFTTAALARHVGLAEGTIFRHFSDKADIVCAAIDRIEELFHGSLPPEDAADDPLDRLGVFVRHRLTIIREHPGIPRLLFSDQLAHAASDRGVRRLEAMRRESLGFIRDRIREAHDRGLLRGGLEPGPLFFLVHGAALAVAFSGPLVEQDGLEADPEAIWANLERLLRA
ncbi:MAG: TetR/AcrR family transcriptional regulator [Myxococcota bacterium]